MNRKPPQLLPSRALNGLEKLGDSLLPGDDQFESFSRLGCAYECDRILKFMPDKDRKDLTLLLTLLSFLPKALIKMLVFFLEKSDAFGPFGSALRMVRLGLRGLVVTLYYSHPKTHEKLGYSVDVYTKDLASSRQ